MQASRLAERILMLAIAAGCLIVLQKSFHFINTAPFLNVDDSIPNVAVSLAEHGRYGFLSSPTQGRYEVDRTYAFFNYGPLYFYIAAALTWLFGPSLELYRMLHPIGLVFIVLASFWAFRRVSVVGTAVLAMVLLDIYLTSHSPIARPDIIVSVCATLMLVFAARAVQNGGWWNWFGLGFFAASAVTTHQIAAAMIPAAGIVWIWSMVAERRESNFKQRATASIVALLGGGVAAVWIYLAAIDFRLGDLWTLGSAGMQARNLSYVQLFRLHFGDTWSSRLRPVEALFCLAGVLSMASWFFGATARRRVMAFVMPPVVASVLYQLSVGFYNTRHPGYVILSQVLTVWAVAAMVALAVAWARDRFGEPAHLTAVAAALLAVVTVGAAWARTPSTEQIRAVGSVDMNDYVRQVLAPLPERAAVWGSVYFGVDAGDRTDLVQFQQAFGPALDFMPAGRSMVEPDFLVLSAYEFADAIALNFVGQDSALFNFFKIFPAARYRALKLIDAPPYGSSIVYGRAQTSASIPEVAVNDGTGRQWSSRLGNPLTAAFRPADPVEFEIYRYAIHAIRPALGSLAADLPAGSYLIEIEIQTSSEQQTGFILASTDKRFTWKGQDRLPVWPYLVGERRIAILANHAGGMLYLSRYEQPSSAQVNPRMQVLSVRPIVPLAGTAGPSPREFYVDRLMVCRSPYIHAADEDCIHPKSH